MIRGIAAAAALALSVSTIGHADERPNIIVIMADDMGAADWRGGGSEFIATPHLDRMAADGVVLTDFHASANVCTPSRAGLLTGRYPVRAGLARGVIHPWSTSGLPGDEITIAEMLSQVGYATQLVGKWHLGSIPEAHPLEHGFDAFFGVPYSNDMSPFPLIEGRTVIEERANQSQLTRRYTEAATAFIGEQAEAGRPFFIYLAHTMPHIPLFASEAFHGRSAAGRYGDTIEELDWSVGQIRAALEDAGEAEDTLVIFTSDNGPWFEGSSGRRGRKGGTYDGAYRVPFVAAGYGAGAGVTSDAMATNLDLLPTIAVLTGAPAPQDRVIDGQDISALLQGSQISPHEALAFFEDDRIAAVRTERWRYVVRAYYKTFLVPFEQFDASLLFDLETHSDELFDMSADHPDTVAEMNRRLATLRAELEGLPQQETPFPRPDGAPIQTFAQTAAEPE